jgi:hypothetical protein
MIAVLGIGCLALVLVVGTAHAQERSSSRTPRATTTDAASELKRLQEQPRATRYGGAPVAEDERIAAVPRPAIEIRDLPPPQVILIEGVGRLRRNPNGEFEPVAARPLPRPPREEPRAAPPAPTPALSQAEFEAFMASGQATPRPEPAIDPELRAQFERFFREREAPRQPDDLTRWLNARQTR